MRQPELTSLIGLQDSDGDRLHLVRVNQTDGTRGYVMRVGTARVLLTAGDLGRLSNVIRFELASANWFRYFARTVWLAILCGLVWLVTAEATGPLFAYPWSN